MHPLYTCHCIHIIEYISLHTCHFIHIITYIQLHIITYIHIPLHLRNCICATTQTPLHMCHYTDTIAYVPLHEWQYIDAITYGIRLLPTCHHIHAATYMPYLHTITCRYTHSHTIVYICAITYVPLHMCHYIDAITQIGTDVSKYKHLPIHTYTCV